MLRRYPFVVAALAISLVATGVATADESFEAAAKALSSATVTVRMRLPSGEAKLESKGSKEAIAESDAKQLPLTDPKDLATGEGKAAQGKLNDDELSKNGLALNHNGTYRQHDGVIVASGVCVGENLIVTAMRPQAGCDFRVTLPGGKRAKAELRVVDANCSLVLLESKADGELNKSLPPVALTTKPHSVGARLLTASALGAEPPTVSSGVLGAIDRFMPSSGLPPLLQCDVHTTETSRGAGVVNSAGELVGVIVAIDFSNRRANWTYLIPAEHVARLVAARKGGQVVELPRRVAHAGIDLRQSAESDAIVVRNVTTGGPADRAGIKVGDELLSVDGREVHSVFAAARVVAGRKPGDQSQWLIRRDGKEQTCVVTLEESAGEPTFSFAAKAKSTNEPDNANLAPRAIEEPRLKDNSKRAPAAVDPASSNSVPGKVDDIDSFAALRERLRQKEDAIKRLEAELAELRREHERLAGTLPSNQPQATQPREPAAEHPAATPNPKSAPSRK